MEISICCECVLVTWLPAIVQQDRRSGTVDFIFIDLSPEARGSRAR